MFTLRKHFSFEAAHMLPRHDGKCRRLHGHSWTGWVEVSGMALQPEGPMTGMLVDYSVISGSLAPLLDAYLDHHYLNETLPFESPTAEEVARWIFQELARSGLAVTAVAIDETCTSQCTYREGGP